MPWIKLDTSFFRHPKTAELMVNKGGAEAVIALQKIWCWAGESDSTQARQGYISDAMVTTIGVNARQAKALEEAGFLHRNGTGWHIHDWDDHQGALLDKRTRDRQKRRRPEVTDDEN